MGHRVSAVELPDNRPSTTSDIAGVIADDGRRLVALSDHEAVHLGDVDADRPAGPPLVGPTSRCALTGGDPGIVIIASAIDEAIAVWRARGLRRPRPGPVRAVATLRVGADVAVPAGGGDLHGVTDAARCDQHAQGHRQERQAGPRAEYASTTCMKKVKYRNVDSVANIARPMAATTAIGKLM
ncbi:MAG: hypothetical protein ACRDNL_01635 [Spirillospora sp.]